MPKFAANLSMLFTESEFMDRFKDAGDAGFRGVEYLFPYAFKSDEIADALARNNLEQVLFNLPAGDWAAGERGIACLPDRVGEFQDGVGQAIEYAKALDCKQINCLAGIRPAELDMDRAMECFSGNLLFASKSLMENGIRLLHEPINHYDIPGYLINHTDQALAVFDAVGADSVLLQYDIYHMQRMEGELAATMTRLLSRIGHIQIADNPGRNEPGSGEINYRYLLKLIDEIGYKGWVGCEYVPSNGTLAGLDWRVCLAE